MLMISKVSDEEVYIFFLKNIQFWKLIWITEKISLGELNKEEALEGGSDSKEIS